MENKSPNNFIMQTAIDYDMDYEIVEKLYNLYPTLFYEKLENIIKERQK